MKALRAILKWGISYDLVPPEVLAKVQSVPAVKKGEYPWLKETKKRVDVPDEVVLQTLPFLPPTVADMVRLQRGASMRPGEVCGLKVGDLDMSGDLWHVGKQEHKTASTGVTRFFAFNRAETEILRRRCVGKLREDYLIFPARGDGGTVGYEIRRQKKCSPAIPANPGGKQNLNKHGMFFAE